MRNMFLQLRMIIAELAIGLSVVTLSCSDNAKKQENAMDNQNLRNELDALRSKRIFFGHQSVGANVVTGLKDLLSTVPDVHLNMVSLTDSAFPSGPVFVDTYIGENSQPKTKCDAFTSRVTELSASFDLALMKFCYIDLTEGTDVEDLFTYYRDTIQELKRRCPNVKLVHVTVPLTRRGASWKVLVKKLLGRIEYNDIANLKREEFNRLLVHFYKDEPVFDLASIESTFPDGTRNSFSQEGKTGYSLIDEYADDGDHLGPLGRELAARELVHTLAAACGRTPGK